VLSEQKEKDMLTSKQHEVLEFIQGYIKEHDYQPTLQEIANYFGLVKSTVHKHVQNLIEANYLGESDGKPAFIAIKPNTSSTALPLLGSIAAGLPIEAIPELETIDFADMFQGADRYLLRVKGESMVEKGIMDGDYAVIKRAQTARNGEIVVALIDGWEATLKTLFNRDNGVVELRPENKEMEPMFFQAKQVIIQGVMVGLIRDQTF